VPIIVDIPVEEPVGSGGIVGLSFGTRVLGTSELEAVGLKDVEPAEGWPVGWCGMDGSILPAAVGLSVMVVGGDVGLPVDGTPVLVGVILVGDWVLLALGTGVNCSKPGEGWPVGGCTTVGPLVGGFVGLSLVGLHDSLPPPVVSTVPASVGLAVPSDGISVKVVGVDVGLAVDGTPVLVVGVVVVSVGDAILPAVGTGVDWSMPGEGWWVRGSEPVGPFVGGFVGRSLVGLHDSLPPPVVSTVPASVGLAVPCEGITVIIVEGGFGLPVDGTPVLVGVIVVGDWVLLALGTGVNCSKPWEGWPVGGCVTVGSILPACVGLGVPCEGISVLLVGKDVGLARGGSPVLVGVDVIGDWVLLALGAGVNCSKPGEGWPVEGCVTVGSILPASVGLVVPCEGISVIIVGGDVGLPVDGTPVLVGVVVVGGWVLLALGTGVNCSKPGEGWPVGGCVSVGCILPASVGLAGPCEGISVMVLGRDVGLSVDGTLVLVGVVVVGDWVLLALGTGVNCSKPGEGWPVRGCMTVGRILPGSVGFAVPCDGLTVMVVGYDIGPTVDGLPVLVGVDVVADWVLLALGTGVNWSKPGEGWPVRGCETVGKTVPASVGLAISCDGLSVIVVRYDVGLPVDGPPVLVGFGVVGGRVLLALGMGVNWSKPWEGWLVGVSWTEGPWEVRLVVLGAVRLLVGDEVASVLVGLLVIPEGNIVSPHS
jgi:hypothetical protein